MADTRARIKTLEPGRQATCCGGVDADRIPKLDNADLIICGGYRGEDVDLDRLCSASDSDGPDFEQKIPLSMNLSGPTLRHKARGWNVTKMVGGSSKERKT